MAARATVLIPTYGQARFARWAVKSAQRQSVADLEIRILCDGSPPEMVAFFEDMAREDARIQVLAFPKSPRTGEPYRHLVLAQTTGRIVCYLSHDDLWLENHVAELEKSLASCPFTHSLQAVVRTPAESGGEATLKLVNREDLRRRRVERAMLDGNNFFGLSFAAHTREAYAALSEGWVTTPIPHMATDLYMWRKFLAAFPGQSRTVRKLTALNFPKPERLEWTEAQRDAELEQYFEEIQEPRFVRELEAEVRRLATLPGRLLRRLKRLLRGALP